MAVDLSGARPTFAAMHELALSESVIDAVIERIPDARIVRVRLRVGRLMAVMPDALRFCFEIAAQGTRLAGAELVIDEVAARGRCRACGYAGELAPITASCIECGSVDVAIESGRELQIESVEVE